MSNEVKTRNTTVKRSDSSRSFKKSSRLLGLIEKKHFLLFIIIFAVVGSGSYFVSKGFAGSAIGQSEAESLVGSGVIVSDPMASGGKALKLTGNTPATGNIVTTAPGTSVVIHAKGTQCGGAPIAQVNIDGAQVSLATVSGTSWDDYTVTTPVSEATHSVSVVFTNPYSKPGRGKNNKGACTRTLYVDYIQVQDNASTSPSGQPMPTADVTSGGHTWHISRTEDFTKDAPLGSWADDCTPDKVLYTGDTGTKWTAYPKCYTDTYQHRAYRSDQVLSVHDGYLDFWLHTVDGHPAGANPAPFMPNDTLYQTYGRYEARIRQTTHNLSDYHQAWLLWPADDADWECAESDFPELAMSSNEVAAFAHNCVNYQDYFSKSVDTTQWHTYTQEWGPGFRKYYVDGSLIGTSTNQVYDKGQRWQLQTETNTNCESTNSCTQDGHLQVDWVVVYSY